MPHRSSCNDPSNTARGEDSRGCAGGVPGFGRVSDGSNSLFRRRRGVGRTNREETQYSVVHLELSFFGAVRGWYEAARRAPTGGSIATDRKAIRPSVTAR